MDLKTLELLTSLPGGSGQELNVRKVMEDKLSKASEILKDGFGGVFGKFEGTKDDVKVMVCAHMDEVSLMVTKVREDGFLEVMPIGGINVEAFVSQNVLVHGSKDVRGLISSIPPHIAKGQTIPDFSAVVLDIGCDSDEEVKKLGINIGTYATPVPSFYLTENKKYVVNKAMDDRLGCYVVSEIIKKVDKIKHPNTLYLGATVQEEVGLRGAQVASNMIKPDLFITVDVSPASDYLGKKDSGVLGKGFLIRYYDPRNIMPIKLREYFIELAENNKIDYQLFKSAGGTDAGAAQYAGNGILATTVGIPGRYIHSPATMVSIEDIESAVKFVTKLIENFDKETLDKLHE